jgi:hypothetical protein
VKERGHKAFRRIALRVLDKEALFATECRSLRLGALMGCARRVDLDGICERMIQDDERHVDFLDAQLYAIKEMGIANYLAQLLHAEKIS